MPHSDLVFVLGGDLMLGRGVDQILPHSNDPTLFESWRRVTDARVFIEAAVQKNGPLPSERDSTYVWGEMIGEFNSDRADLRVVNLECALTTNGEPWKGKNIHYRTHPLNIETLKAANLDVASLANNHVLDWGYPGLSETLKTLGDAGIRSAGAGGNLQQAFRPAVLDLPGKGRVAVFAFGTPSSHIPSSWGAGDSHPGIALLALTDQNLHRLVKRIRSFREANGINIAIASIHWGGNWGHAILERIRRFAHGLIDRAGIDLIHGHSSHHVRGIEVHRGKLILYGCGELLDDYEGIPLLESSKDNGRSEAHHQFSPELGLIYRVTVNPENGNLRRLCMVPIRIRRLQIGRAEENEVSRLADVLNQAGKPLGTGVDLEGGKLDLTWAGA